MEKTSWTDRVRNEEVLLTVKEKRNNKGRLTGLVTSCVGTAFPKHVIEGKKEGRMEMMGRRPRRRKQLLDDLKEKRGYTKIKEEALDRTLWTNRFGRGYGFVV
jgi:hypothetical protein